MKKCGFYLFPLLNFIEGLCILRLIKLILRNIPHPMLFFSLLCEKGFLGHSYNILLQILEDKIISFVKNELKKIQTDLSPDELQCFKSQCEDEDVLQGVDEEQSKSSREAFVMITVDFLKRMKQNKFAERLLRSEN